MGPMNYFAHGFSLTDEPYVLAGACLPDWLSASDRRVRVRIKHPDGWLAYAPTPLCDLARGVLRHQTDDAWFHQTAAFARLSLEFSRAIRLQARGADDLRPMFLGHILVELLLDALLIAEHPQVLERFYAALDSLDRGLLVAAVNRLSPLPAARLGYFVALFLRERFLWDYLEDATLCRRLEQVLRRVALPPLPDGFRCWLPQARAAVRDALAELLAEPRGWSPGAAHARDA